MNRNISAHKFLYIIYLSLLERNKINITITMKRWFSSRCLFRGACNRFAIYDRLNSVNSSANLRIDSAQVRISALRLAGAVRRHVRCHPRRDRNSGRRCTPLHHASAHVWRGWTDAAQTAQTQIGRSQIRGEIAAAIMRSVKQSATWKESNVYIKRNDDMKGYRCFTWISLN